MPRSISRNSLKLYRRTAAVALVLAGPACADKAKFGGTSLDKVQPVLLADQSFAAATIGNETLRFKPAFGTVVQQMTLKEKPPLVSLQHQTYRTPLAQPDRFQQGRVGSTVIEEFTISSAAKMDLLVVLDNSNSMAAQQTTLSKGLPALISGLDNIDWQIGVITSDAEGVDDPIESNRGCHLYDSKGKAFDAQGNLTGTPILKSDQAAAVKFADTIQNIGVGGSNREELIRNTYRAVTGTCGEVKQEWLRKDALLGILFVTDEDSYCASDDPSGIKDAGGNTLCKPGERPEDLITVLRPPYMPANQVRVYSLTYHGSMPTPGSAQAQRPAARILSVVNAFGGFDDSIEQDDYASTLARISTDAAKIVKRQFNLKSAPIGNSMQVRVDGKLTTDYQIVGNMLSVSGLDADTVQLRVSYRIDPYPLFNQVTTSKTPNLASLAVTVNDVTLAADQYTFDAKDNTVHFHTTPPDDAVIKVDYRVGADLSSNFVLEGATDTKPLAIAVDAIPITDYDWDGTSHTIHFKSPPPDGALVAASYRGPGGKITDYDLASNAAEAVRITITDATSQSPIKVTQTNGKISFAQDEVQDGRVVDVTYDYGDRSKVLSHELAHAPLDGTLTLKVDDGSVDCLHQIRVEGQKLLFTCDATTLGELELKYQYLISRNTTFNVDQDIPADAYVQVFIDGQAYSGYTRDGRHFTIPEADLSLSSKVRILINTDANGGVRR